VLFVAAVRVVLWGCVVCSSGACCTVGSVVCSSGAYCAVGSVIYQNLSETIHGVKFEIRG